MGILNLLRNAFGKSRKGRTSEGADVPAAAERGASATVPAPAAGRHRQPSRRLRRLNGDFCTGADGFRGGASGG